MNKTAVVAIVCMLSVSLMGAVSLVETESKRFEVAPLFSFEYLRAGDSGIPLAFRVDNRSAEKVEDVYARLSLSFPFSATNLARKELRSDLYRLDDLEKFSSKVAQFKIDVSKDAAYGDYTLLLIVSYADPTNPSSRIEEPTSFSLHVTGETLVEVADMQVGRDGVAMVGEDFSVRFSVVNKGDNALEWLKVSLAIDDPALVLKEGSLKVLEGLRGGSVTELSYALSIDNNAAPRNYLVRIVLDYKDERNVVGQVTVVSGIKVVGAPKLSIGGKTLQPPILTAGEDFTLTLKIDNTGTEDAEGVRLALGTEFSGDREAYLGKIERDDYANAVFLLTATEGGEQRVVVHITYEYAGSAGQQTKEEAVTLIVRPQSNSNYLLIAAGALLVVLLLVLAMRFLRKK